MNGTLDGENTDIFFVSENGCNTKIVKDNFLKNYKLKIYLKKNTIGEPVLEVMELMLLLENSVSICDVIYWPFDKNISNLLTVVLRESKRK